jgi:hypothetical protein
MSHASGLAMIVTIVLPLITLAPSVNAYEGALNASALHEAYVLGQRNDQATANFLAPYNKQTSEGTPGGPHIAEIEILTPFAQVVDRSRQKLSDYTEQKAAQDYQHEGNTVIVRVLLMLPAAYPKREAAAGEATSNSSIQNSELRPENFWQNFRFNVKQHGKILPPRSIHNVPVYSAATKETPSALDGATVFLEYDARDVLSDLITVEVTAPDAHAQPITAEFDLRKLR